MEGSVHGFCWMKNKRAWEKEKCKKIDGSMSKWQGENETTWNNYERVGGQEICWNMLPFCHLYQFITFHIYFWRTTMCRYTQVMYNIYWNTVSKGVYFPCWCPHLPFPSALVFNIIAFFLPVVIFYFLSKSILVALYGRVDCLTTNPFIFFNLKLNCVGSSNLGLFAAFQSKVILRCYSLGGCGRKHYFYSALFFLVNCQKQQKL